MRTKREKRQKRQRLLRDRVASERISNENKNLKNLIVFLFMSGLLLQIWEVFIFRQTIIDLRIPIFIWLTPGLFLTPTLYRKLNEIGGDAHWSLHYILHTSMTGAILLFCFMAINFYFPKEEVTTREFKVIETGHLKMRPYVIINYDGLEKQLVFPRYGNNNVSSAESVKVKIKEGLFGFDILVEYEVN